MATTPADYATPGRITDLSAHAQTVDRLPGDVRALVQVLQRLLIYDVVAPDFYGQKVPADRADEIHIRPMTDLIDHALRLDSRPLQIDRPPSRRVFSRCRHYAVLLTALLRHHRIPARARCGFADYFNPGSYEDHWVCEYWTGAEWVLVDAQLDDVWQRELGLDFDPFDVPRDRFIVAGEAWVRCRSGAADPDAFGIGFVGHRGLWFVAGDLVRDIAALTKSELLPWDVWGAQPAPDASLAADELGYFDRLAELSRMPDADPDAVRAAADDDGVRVPDQVFNALRGVSERPTVG